jgi:phosphoribosylformylglycinamidine cyclo-ligase
LGAKIIKGSWPVHEIFNFLQKHGQIPEEQMYNIFNMGIGMVLVVSPEEAEKIDAPAIGKVVKGEGVSFA